VDTAIEQLFDRDDWTRQAVEAAAAEHRVCPFELSLDLCMWAECVVCDYNYAFDPRVYLRRFFQEEGTGDNIFLVDEAHNLVDRAREMFSAEISKEAVLGVRRQVKGILPAVHRSLTRINTWLLAARRVCAAGEPWRAEAEPPQGLYPLLEKFVRLTDRWLRRNERADFRDPLLELYFSVTAFLRVAELFDPAYVTCYQQAGEDLRVRLFCLDPAANLNQALTRCRSAVFFSATMTPTDYFKQIFGCESAGALVLPSPFAPENFGVFLCDRISTLYRQREETAGAVLDAVCSLVLSRPGNYLAFFPSYAYLEKIATGFQQRHPDVDTIVQSAGMGEGLREAFLARFSAQNQGTLVGFVVMGGVFGEGIDLVGERLCGAAVVGVGLPAVCPERDLIRRYFQDKRGTGFEFAYLFPGINRVLQAAGRVIRSETDKGVLLLVDRRYASPHYRQLLPGHWRPVRTASAAALQRAIVGFWGNSV
jgi:DNA excision repair protein ERCC-2